MSFFRTDRSVVVAPGEGTQLDVLGEVLTLLVSGEQTNGAFTIITEKSRPGGGTPLHTHRNEDEALYVLEGEYEIRCGNESIRATPGSFVFAPRNIPHKLTNVGPAAGRVLGVVSPAGFEGFWKEVSALPSPTDMNAVMEIAAKYRLEVHPG